nr:MAG TPA_asm: hypothetical protein [Caudoviricetes sp.]
MKFGFLFVVTRKRLRVFFIRRRNNIELFFLFLHCRK